MNHLLALITTDNNVCGHWSNLGRKQTTAMVLDRRLMLCCRPLLFWSTLWARLFQLLPERTRQPSSTFSTSSNTHRHSPTCVIFQRKENSSPSSVVLSLFSLSLILFFDFFQHLFEIFKNKILCLGFFFSFFARLYFQKSCGAMAGPTSLLWPAKQRQSI